MTNRSPNLASPGLRLRSPQSKSNIAISRGDSIDYGITNTKAHAYNGEQQEVITLVFSKKKLLCAALSFIAYTAVVVLAVVFATKSDGTSTVANMTSKASSSSLSSSIMEIGGSNTNSNTAIENSGGLSSNQVNQSVDNNNLDTTANIVATTTNNLPVSAYGGKTSKYSRESSKTSKEAGGSKSSKGTYSSFYNLCSYITISNALLNFNLTFIWYLFSEPAMLSRTNGK